MDYIICDAASADLDALEVLERECFSVPWTRSQLASQLPDEGHVFILAKASGAVIGYVGMMYVIDEGYISNVAVAADARRRGVGGALVAALLSRARELGLAFVTLEVRRGNLAAIALYSKLGFRPVGERRGYYDRPKEDAILMTNFLK